LGKNEKRERDQKGNRLFLKADVIRRKEKGGKFQKSAILKGGDEGMARENGGMITKFLHCDSITTERVGRGKGGAQEAL